jgi:membrane associated rhomboid family serine protease
MVKLPRVRYVTVLGAHLPNTVLGLVIATAATTILGVLMQHASFPLIALLDLQPERVFRGELWRLVTWTFLELSPIGLIFACLLLAWLGRDLSSAWGHWRFVGVYLGFAAAVALATCLVALAWPAVRALSYATAWAMCDAILIAWAIHFPSRQILLYFVLPIGGRNLVILTIAGTALFALFSHPVYYIPHFVAIAFMLVFARYPALDLLWMRLRLLLLRRSSSRRSATLRVVRDDPKSPPRWYH